MNEQSYRHCRCWARSTEPRDLEMVLARSRHQKIAHPPRDGAAPTHNDFYHTIVRYDWLDSFLGWSMIG